MSHPIYRLTETAPPGAEPLTLEETKLYLRVDHDNDDALIAGLIAAARGLCESVTGRSLIARSYSLFLDVWPRSPSSLLGVWWNGLREGAVTGSGAALSLPRPPLLSVTRINIYAADNTAEEFPAANYFVDTASHPGRIVLKETAAAPLPGRSVNGIEIQFRAGYGLQPQSVPSLLRHGMKQAVAYLYEHRGDSPEQALFASGAALAFQPYRSVSVA